MTEQEKFYQVYPHYSGVLEMHEAGSIDWLNAMIPVRMFAVWQSAKESAKEEFANLCELSYGAKKENYMHELPDGIMFFFGSFPLPKDHWLYAPNAEGWDSKRNCLPDTPLPILDESQRAAVNAAVRWAVRGATMNGTEPDFDPDALVLNAAYALCGPCGTRRLT